MRALLIAKVSFWMIVIGVFALLAPNPAWDPLYAKLVLGGGIALGAGALLLGAWRSRRP